MEEKNNTIRSYYNRNVFNPQYVSDLIKYDDIQRWRINEKILITAPTGKGKSYFIKNDLYNYCKLNNKKILYLTNRNILKNQFKKEIDDSFKNDIINIVNYQMIENYILNHIEKIPDDFDFIIADECHYVFNDACFNSNTELTINWLINLKNKILIMLSATSDHIRQYLESQKKLHLTKYFLYSNIDYLNSVYFYQSQKALKKMLFQLPKGEKAIYFASAKKAYNVSQDIKDAEFICSNNNMLSQFSCQKLYQQIIDEEKFDCQILCTTSVLDNGVNIKDKGLKHVIVDYFDTDTLVQCIGRKRILDSKDRITLYIRNRNKKSLSMTLSNFQQLVEQAEYLKQYGNIEFVRKYGRKPLNRSIYLIALEGIDVKFNDMMYNKILSDIEDAKDMIKIGYDFMIGKRLNIDLETTHILESEFDSYDLLDKLNALKGEKLFKKEKAEFKEFLLHELFGAPKKNHGSCGLKTINLLLRDNHLNFQVKAQIENSRKSDNWKQTYWIIVKEETDEKVMPAA